MTPRAASPLKCSRSKCRCCPQQMGDRILRQVLAMLGKRGMNEIWVEAGPTLAGAFVRARLFDELIVYIAPALLGQGARPLLDLPPLQQPGRQDVAALHRLPVRGR